jgi:hypothetical protein
MTVRNAYTALHCGTVANVRGVTQIVLNFSAALLIWRRHGNGAVASRARVLPRA